MQEQRPADYPGADPHYAAVLGEGNQGASGRAQSTQEGTESKDQEDQALTSTNVGRSPPRPLEGHKGHELGTTQRLEGTLLHPQDPSQREGQASIRRDRRSGRSRSNTGRLSTRRASSPRRAISDR